MNRPVEGYELIAQGTNQAIQHLLRFYDLALKRR